MEKLIHLIKEYFLGFLSVVVVLGLAGTAVLTLTGFGDKITSTFVVAEEMSYTVYDGNKVTGNTLLGLIQNQKQALRTDGIQVFVRNGSGDISVYGYDVKSDNPTSTTSLVSSSDFATGVWITDLSTGDYKGSYATSTGKGELHYINRNGEFKSSVLRDKNGAMKIIFFDQITS